MRGRLALAELEPERRRERGRDVRRVGHRGQVDHMGAVGEPRREPSSQLQRQRGLSHPARPGQRQQPGVLDQPGERVEVALAPEQRRDRRRQRARGR
jgi:hypothetical protein